MIIYQFFKKHAAIFLCLGLIFLHNAAPISHVYAAQTANVPDADHVADETEKPEAEERGAEEEATEESAVEVPEIEMPEEGDTLSDEEFLPDLLAGELDIINEHTVEVSTYEAFIAALQNPGYTDIYFADNITGKSADNQAFIKTVTGEQRIYGHAYGGNTIFTYTQHQADVNTQTILVQKNSGTTQVTIKDMNIVGSNSKGIVHVNGVSDVTTLFENVTFRGPQLVMNELGTVRLTDVDIELIRGISNIGRAVDAYNIIFDGESNLRTSHSVTQSYVFNMTNLNTTVGTGEFRVRQNASVHVTTHSVLFHSAGTDSKSPVLQFEKNSNFEAICDQGFIPQYFKELNVDKNASVRFVQTRATNDGFALRLRRQLLVEEGAVFEVLRPVGTTAAIHMYEPGTITFNNPERVVIYSNRNFLIGSVANTEINISTDAVNIWAIAPDGSSEAEPTQIWNKRGSSTLSIYIPFSGYNVIGPATTSNLDMDEDPVSKDINYDTIGLRTSQLMVLGRIGLNIDNFFTNHKAVTGTTEPGASLSGIYTTADGSAVTLENDIAGTDGTFKLPLNGGAPQTDSRIYATTYKNKLRMKQYTTFQNEEEPILKFLSVPDLYFERIKIPFVPTYVKRADSDWTVAISDTRKNSPGFSVQVSVTEPLTADKDGTIYTIPDGLIYVDDKDRSIALTDQPITIYSDDSGMQGTHTIDWEDGQGLLVLADPVINLRADVEYSTIINWMLVSVP